MKKILTLILVMSAIVANSQITDYSTQQTDINFYVNDSRPAGSLTGALMNSFMNRLLENPSSIYHDATRPNYEDTTLVLRTDKLWIANTDNTGAWNSSQWYGLIGFSDANNSLHIGDGAYSSATSSILFGEDAGAALSSLSNSVIQGYQSVSQGAATPNNITVIGHQAGYNSTGSPFGSVAIGALSGYTQLGSGSTFVGYKTGEDNTADANTFIGFRCGEQNTSGTENTLIGNNAGATNTTADNNTIIGTLSGASMASTGASANTIIGHEAGRYITGAQNVILGASSVSDVTSLGGSDNVIIGFEAGNVNSLSNNVFIGSQAGKSTTIGQFNTFIGKDAGLSNIGGKDNVFIGFEAGEGNTTGIDNIYIGYRAGKSNTTESNQLYIESSSSSTPLIYGDFSADSARINGTLIVKDLFSIEGEATIASAATVTLDSLNITVTGTADIDSIDASSLIPENGIIYILFTGTAATNGVVDGKNLIISGNFAYTPDDMMVLQRRGDNFYLISESAN